MPRYKILHPDKSFTGSINGLTFADGVAETSLGKFARMISQDLGCELVDTQAPVEADAEVTVKRKTKIVSAFPSEG